MKKNTISDFDTSLNQALSRTTRLAPRVLLLLLLVSSIALLISAFSFERRLEAVQLANSDNTGWIIAQLEVDQQDLMLSLATALPNVGQDPRETKVSTAQLQRIKRNFDILYSRITVFEAGLKRNSASPALLAEFEKLRLLREELANKIDSITTPDIPALEEFRRSVVEAYPLVRGLAVAALQENVAYTAEMRQQERSVFIVFLVQSIVLVALMVLSAFLAMYIWRDLEKKTAEKFRIGGLLSRAFDATFNAVLVTDQHARILYGNPMARKIFGTGNTSLEGINISHLISLEDSKVPDMGENSGKFGAFSGLIDAGPKIVGSKNAKGDPIFIEMLLERDKDMSGREVVICFIRDITDQVVAEESLKDALRLAEEASSAKSSFLATMSHEMRTPLHGIMASLELMRDSDLNAANLTLLETAEACSHRALTQVNNVLEMARLGQQHEASSVLQPDHIAQDIIRELKPLADTSQNRLELILQGPFRSYQLEGLPYTFSQVLYNLVDNAIKFTEKGSIVVRLALSRAHSGSAVLSVEVTDTGIGISKEVQQLVFEEFKTADLYENHAKTGSGLGLSIAKRGVEMQGGELQVSSRPGKGSRFFFELSLQAVPADVNLQVPVLEADLSPATADVVKRKILIVDDSEINLSLMREMLMRMGHSVDMAEDGKVAVEKASKTQYDAILMDFSMPVMDGPTAAEKIRALETTPEHMAIIGVTALIGANADPRNQELFDDILIKPVGQAQLAAAIEDNISGPAPIVSMAPASPDPAPFVPSDNMIEAYDPAASTSFDEVVSLVGKETAINLMKTSFDDVALALRAMGDPSVAIKDKAAPIHKSVGSTALLGLEELSEALSEAEMLALADRDPNETELPHLIEALLKEARFEFGPLIDQHHAGSAAPHT